MFGFFILLLCLVNHCGTPTVGQTPVSGERGGNVTLTCELKAQNIIQTDLHSKADEIPVCKTEEKCSGRVFKTGPCDIIIKNLTFSDAQTYILTVHYNDEQETQEQPYKKTYHLHIHDEIAVKIGMPLKLDLLLDNAYKIETNSSGEWKEIWNRSGVWSDHMTERDGNLLIEAFMASDAGTYRVVDSEGEIWITVTITESGTRSAGESKDAEPHGARFWILCVGLPLAVIGIGIGIIKWLQHRGHFRRTVHEAVRTEDEGL